MKYVNGTDWIIRTVFFTVKGFYFRKKNVIIINTYVTKNPLNNEMRKKWPV